MHGKFKIILGALCIILSAMLIIPTWGQAKEENMGQRIKAFRTQLIKGLKLPPDKEKELLAAEEKYAAERQSLIAGLKKADEDLQKALAAAKPDEAKVKDLVTTITTGQENLFASFRKQQKEEMDLMTPVQQGKYILALSKWRHKMMEQIKAKKPEKKK
jgi:Spy/CpxP family protein refolding chaperone